MTFAHPDYFLLLLFCIPIILWYALRRHRQEPSLRVADSSALSAAPFSLRAAAVHLPFVLRMLVFALAITILARPQTNTAYSEHEVEGIDIMIAMDISTSMLTPDLEPNRIEAAKQVAYEFIARRKSDNIGLTLFGGEAFTQCPMTTDHTTLLSMFRNVTSDLQTNGLIAEGTAIGMGLTNAVSKLAESKTKSKIVILLTDGTNNTGEISPLTAAEIAKQKQVRVYTIAVGKSGSFRQPISMLPDGSYYYATVKSDMDTTTLRAIAQTTGGKFYEAASKDQLEKIYQEIDQLERTKFIQQNHGHKFEAYSPFAWVALGLLLLEIVLRLTWLRRIP